jgi:hypothetical protein
LPIGFVGPSVIDFTNRPACLYSKDIKGEITKEDIDSGLASIVFERRSEPEMYLSGFSTAEQRVIVNMAKTEPVQPPQGKDFVQHTGLTAAGVRKIIMKLEKEAAVYKRMTNMCWPLRVSSRIFLRFRL